MAGLLQGCFKIGAARPPGLEPAVLAGLAGPAVLKLSNPRGPKTKQPWGSWRKTSVESAARVTGGARTPRRQAQVLRVG